MNTAMAPQELVDLVAKQPATADLKYRPASPGVRGAGNSANGPLAI